MKRSPLGRIPPVSVGSSPCDTAPVTQRSTHPSKNTSLRWLVGGVLAISFAASFFRWAAPTHPLVSAGGRLLIAGVFLSPWLLKTLRSHTGKNLYGLLASGGLLYALHFGLWVWSLNETSVAASTTLVTTTPLILGVIGWWTGRDAPSRIQWAAIVVSAVGIILLGSASDSGQWLGNILAFVAAFAMGAYLLLVRGSDYPSILALQSGNCLVGGTVLLGLAGGAGIELRPVSWVAGLSIVASAVVSQLLGHSALMRALKDLTPTTVGLATAVEPVIATLIAWLLLDECPSTLVLFGCAIVVFAVLLNGADAFRTGRETPP